MPKSLAHHQVQGPAKRHRARTWLSEGSRQLEQVAAEPHAPSARSGSIELKRRAGHPKNLTGIEKLEEIQRQREDDDG